MDKQRKWQFLLILSVIILTVYNILPTVFYYAKPLKDPVSLKSAEGIAARIAQRVQSLETESLEWIQSYCELLRAKPLSVALDPENPQVAIASFAKEEDARRLKAYLPRAGALIPFAPAQLSLPPQEEGGKEVRIQRKIPVRIEPNDFSYLAKNDLRIAADRIEQLANALGGPSETALLLNSLIQGNSSFSLIETLAAHVNTLKETFGNEETPAASRYFARFTQGVGGDKQAAIQTLLQALTQGRDAISQEKSKLQNRGDQGQAALVLDRKDKNLAAAADYLKKRAHLFAAGKDPLNIAAAKESFARSATLDLSNAHPLFVSIAADWNKDRFLLKFHPDVETLRASGKNKERFQQQVVNEIARIARETSEELIPGADAVSVPLHKLNNATGYLSLDLSRVAERAAKQLQGSLNTRWTPGHPDLAALQAASLNEYLALPVEQQALCLVVFSPLSATSGEGAGMNPDSLYIVAKGIDKIAKHYEQFPQSALAQSFSADFRRLVELLYQDGFVGYPAASAFGQLAKPGDFIFEKPHFYSALLAATREDLLIRGTKRMAVIELTDVEQRIAVENQIDTKIHEDLLKWNDEYRTAQVSLDPIVRMDAPKPTKSIFWKNMALTARKIFRGDERKIIRWGLDLSGGKSVQIELRDANRKPVTSDADIKQGINELYNRVNKMGVSEVSIRQVGNQIALDFPGSQAMPASELIKASTMSFHLVNEKFSTMTPDLGVSVNRFLQEVWNEAVVTGRKDPQSVNEIARKHLHAEKGELRSEATRTLWENGLRIASWNDPEASQTVDDTQSKIAIYRGSEAVDWHGQSHPLLIVFRNWAIEGAHLEHIHAGYDPAKGNFLSFDVASTYESGGKKSHPRNDLHAWTSKYSKEKVQGTSLENPTQGRGWRMAVILNESVISAPALESALRDSAMITGNFTQREVNRLAADLKAGSLTFTPQILSEKNVSPELGQSDRAKGIAATIAALCLVIGSMLAYYRFAGLVASVAVLFNLLILWATLQNLGAAMTLAGLAAVVLTVGMAVDANVLVFERIKEEFAESGNIRSALSAGYKKAYSAIIDSNVTTIIAALILLNFDAGPIKSFAVNLIIGIASSMFTALFMTRFYFTGWIQNPKHAALKMADWIRSTRFDFLKKAKASFAAAAAIILVGSSLIVLERHSIFGMDFTGGYSLNLELENTGEPSYALKVEKALLAAGAQLSDFQVRELSPANHIRILFGTTLEQANKPFYGLPLENPAGSAMKNPRIEWTVHALAKQGIALAPQSLPQIDTQWTAMSGQMSDSMRNNALLGLAISFLCIFVYLAFRFEYKFAAAALICLFHDVLITLGCVGVLHALGLEIQIDLNTIAALMTIVGYSLNDTIIIFDRIREEIQASGTKRLPDLVNRALNATLSRTTITSGTTLLVLIALVLFGGPSLFGFSLVMTIGVFFGTLSSWFIASPLMIFFHRREETKENALGLQKT